jgi:hypothetical protein
VAFFSLSTNSYGFMVLLNVAVFAVAGILGLAFLMRTLNRLQHAEWQAERQSPPFSLESTIPSGGAPFDIDQSVPASIPPPRPGAIERIPGQATASSVRAVFVIWIFVFSLVGAQMGWILRPFIGSPSEPFTWLRPRESNFFESVHEVFLRTVFGYDPHGNHESRASDSVGSNERREGRAFPGGDRTGSAGRDP